jgi:antitoxin (DNA-binding transcriptional repressor) of toxin-antitoxin stability system
MKTVTAREFYHNTGLVDGLADGKQLVVTNNGKPKFVVSRTPRPRMTRTLAAERSVGDPKAADFDGTAFLATLKK